MRTPKRFLPPLLLMVLVATAGRGADLSHSRWDALLKQYVSSESRVDYHGLKQRGLSELDAYLGELAKPWPEDMEPAAIKAALINAYNALTVRWVLSNYPVESIWSTIDPFRAVRHTLDGNRVSLDQIEARLREMHDPRIHSALVCAARSCPPLRREAYTASRLDDQLDDNARRWLADARLNEFFPDRRTAQVSEIYKWYAADFESSGGVRGFLARFAPPGGQAFVGSPEARIEYETYRWGLNDNSALGSDYSQLSFYWDWAKNGYLFDAAKEWFLSLGREHGVNPIVFGSIYVGAIPFFSLSVAWLIRNLRRRRSAALPALCASFCFVSAYLYLLIAGKNIPAWVYLFVAGLAGFGVYSTVRKIKARLHEGGRA
jgi:hypothetical protein